MLRQLSMTLAGLGAGNEFDDVDAGRFVGELLEDDGDGFSAAVGDDRTCPANGIIAPNFSHVPADCRKAPLVPGDEGAFICAVAVGKRLRRDGGLGFERKTSGAVVGITGRRHGYVSKDRCSAATSDGAGKGNVSGGDYKR